MNNIHITMHVVHKKHFFKRRFRISRKLRNIISIITISHEVAKGWDWGCYCFLFISGSLRDVMQRNGGIPGARVSYSDAWGNLLG